MEAEKIQALKGFVEYYKLNPHVLHNPSLAFFKNFLQSLGAQIPAFGRSSNDGEDHEEKKPFDSRKRDVPVEDISNDDIAESEDNQEAAQLLKAKAMEAIAEGYGAPPPPPQVWGQSSNQRTVGRPQSPYGDYRPNMDAVNNPPMDTTTPSVPPTKSLADFDSLTFKQMGLIPVRWENHVPPPSSAPVHGRVETPAPSRRGGRRGGRGRGNRSGSGGPYSVTEDAAVGTDQTESGFWTRLLTAYDEFKPRGAPKRNEDEIREQWMRIQAAVSRFLRIHENNLRLAESGRSEADIKALSYEMYRENGKYPEFTYWEEYLILRESPKFRAICEGEGGSAPKRTRLGLSGHYSSSSGSQSIDLNEEEPPATLSCRRRPPGQQSTLRDARAGASASRSRAGMSAPAEVLSTNLEIQLQRQLIEVLGRYTTETDPMARRMYKALINRLQGQLALHTSDDEAEADADEGADSADDTE